ncbi:hypothetical protein [Photorhabdus laumondii]|uniref:hypothetical protein n=1 Tax=Photorhabdus laumondii TaxID=2218628 RepID=UPI0033157659
MTGASECSQQRSNLKDDGYIIVENRAAFRLTPEKHEYLATLKMIREIGVNLNTVSRSATLTGFKPKKSNTEKRETKKPKYQFNENKNVKYSSRNVKTIKFTIINKII